MDASPLLGKPKSCRGEGDDLLHKLPTGIQRFEDLRSEKGYMQTKGNSPIPVSPVMKGNVPACT